ncbi:MAG: transglutaminase domain-containing protein [Candidatus Latescibacteria bacterium]|nr:transglutaminase domain-containing protein [Candidatus Latescibacterota bacterium]
MRRSLLIVLLLAALPLRASAEPTLAERVDATLARHLDGARIAAWLDTLPQDSLEREAANWILAWLPLSDCAALDLPLLREHVELAATTHSDAIPHALWLHYVVPHRVSQEPAQPWRARFRAELLPRLEGARDMEDVALAVNRWCREQATFTPTSGRDMGPLGTVERGVGRCEEEMILTICALRAAGLPARSCSTPYWTFTDNNHAWVEVWADGRWHYLGGCEPDRCLDRAWFTGPASRAGFVRSTGYGEFDPAPEPLYRRADGATAINSTAVYGTPFTLRASLSPGLAATLEVAERDDPPLNVNVLNFGNLRGLARMDSGDALALGPGEYALTAGSDSALYLRVVSGRPGERVDVTLGEEDRYDLDAAPGFWLRYPEGDATPARDENRVTPMQEGAMDRAVRANAADRAKLRALDADEQAQVDALPPVQRARFTALLATPFPRASALTTLLAAAGDSLAREDLLAWLEACDDKDLFELSPGQIAAELAAGRAVRRRLEAVGLTLPDSLYRQAVLPDRLHYEPATDWRAALPLLPLAADAPASLDALLAAFAARTTSVEATYHGAPLSPDQCWRLGLGTDADLRVALVGLARRNGWPARVRNGRAEVWLDGWIGVDPSTGTRVEEGAPGAAATGRLDLAVTWGGAPYPAAESYRHFNVARLEDGAFSSPWWEPVLGEQDWDAGDFVFSSANRVPGGSVYGRLRRFHVSPDSLTTVSLPLDIGPGWEPGEAFVNVEEPQRLLDRLAGGLLPRVEPGPDCLVFVFTPGEPATRMIEALGHVRDRLRGRGVALVFAASSEAAPTDLLEAAGFGKHDYPDCYLVHFPQSLMEPQSGDPEHPWPDLPIVMLKLNGKIRYCRSGFDTAVDQHLNLVLDLEEAAAR